MDRDKIIDKIQEMQENADKQGFKGQNEYDLFLREEIADYIIELSEQTTNSDTNLNIPDVSNNEVVVGCHTCKHNPHKPYIPKICDKCNPENFSEWQQN